MSTRFCGRKFSSGSCLPFPFLPVPIPRPPLFKRAVFRTFHRIPTGQSGGHGKDQFRQQHGLRLGKTRRDQLSGDDVGIPCHATIIIDRGPL